MKEIGNKYLKLKEMKEELSYILQSNNLHLKVQYNVYDRITKETEITYDPYKYHKLVIKSRCISCKEEELNNIKRYLKRGNIIQLNKPIKFSEEFK